MGSLAVVPEITTDQLDLIKRTVAKDATTDELKLFFYDCQRRNVHPLDKLIFFTKRQGKYTPITSIDFMRSQASDSGEYAGNDDAVFLVDDETQRPTQASVTVYRIVQGQRCPFTATARWTEYFPGDQLGFMWKKMPHTMLGKCAEALALRKAFPRQLAGLYAREEMDQAEQQPKFDREADVEQKKAELAPKTEKGSPEMEWRELLKRCSLPEEFNEALKYGASASVKDKAMMKKILVERANACGLAWDKAKSAFYDPQTRLTEQLEASVADLPENASKGAPEVKKGVITKAQNISLQKMRKSRGMPDGDYYAVLQAIAKVDHGPDIPKENFEEIYREVSGYNRDAE